MSLAKPIATLGLVAFFCVQIADVRWICCVADICVALVLPSASVKWGDL